ncbi:MAG: EAL domain-containing protein [Acidimicrobiia bacterium]|nr:EAL domain-containing protein [Acidimicrobiia bacterium]
MIVPLGEWILDEACHQAAAWRSSGQNGPLSVSVNLSGRQLAQRNIADTVAASIERAGAEPDDLVIELTETVLLDDASSRRREPSTPYVRSASDSRSTTSGPAIRRSPTCGSSPSTSSRSIAAS